MPSFEDLRQTLTELETMKHSELYSLRVAASFANRALFALADPVRRRAHLQEVLYHIRKAIQPFRKMDPNLARLDQSLEYWWSNLRPGPRSFDRNASFNPIHLPGDDEFPGAALYQWAVQHKYSREFAEEMNREMADAHFKVGNERQLQFVIHHLAWRTGRNGTVYRGDAMRVEPVRKLLQLHEISYDKYPSGRYADVVEYIIWVPAQERQQAKRLLLEKGFTR